jgi:hypothetical protein
MDCGHDSDSVERARSVCLLPASHVTNSASMTIRVLLADDNDVVRKVILDLLKSDPEIEVVAECVSFAQTIEIAS